MEKFISARIRLFTGITSLLVVLFLSGSCTKKSESPGLNEVFIQNSVFDPGSLTVAANTTVTWTNKDNMAHTVTSDPDDTESFDSGSIAANKSWSHMFTTAGTFKYHCTFHTTMTATIIVN